MVDGPELPVLDAAERQALVAEWKRLQAEPAPRDRRAVGCLTVIVAIALGALGPALARLAAFDPPQPVKLGAAIALGLVLVVGIFFGVFAGSGRFAHDLQRAEQALEWLAAHAESGNPEELRRQVVALLSHAYCTDGPSTVNTFDFGKARERLGAALAYVLAAERALRADINIYPVFTDSNVAPPG